MKLGEGVIVPEEAFNTIRSRSKETIFLKDLAVLIWGTDVLANRSVSGKKCPGKEGPAKKALTPEKLLALKSE